MTPDERAVAWCQQQHPITHAAMHHTRRLCYLCGPVADAIQAAVDERTKECALLAKNWEPTDNDQGVMYELRGGTELDVAASISIAIRAIGKQESKQ